MNTDPELVKEAVDVKKQVTKAAEAKEEKKKYQSLYKLATIYEKMKIPPK